MNVLGTETFLAIPTVNGDPVTMSSSGSLPSVEAGSGPPGGTPTYGQGTLYVDISNYQIYIYESAAWQCLTDPLAVISISASATAANGYNQLYTYLVSGTSTLTLPTAVNNGNMYTVKNVGTGTVTIATTSSQTIDGSTSAVMKVRYTSLTLVSDGANWNVT